MDTRTLSDLISQRWEGPGQPEFPTPSADAAKLLEKENSEKAPIRANKLYYLKNFQFSRK